MMSTTNTKNKKRSDSMKLLLGGDRIICLDAGKIPTVREMAEADPRIIYVGRIYGNRFEGENFDLDDSFVYAAAWDNLYIVERSIMKNGIAFLYLKSFRVSGWNSTMNRIMDKYDHELYVGDLVDISFTSGQVYFDTYCKCLGHEDRYVKRGKNKVVIKPDLYLLRNYVDLKRWRLIVKTPRGKETCYAFDSCKNAAQKFGELCKSHTIMHNIAPSVAKIKDDNARTELTKMGEEVCKKFNESYSKEGFLDAFEE